MANEPLIQRAGKNYLPFLNAFAKISNRLFKLATKDVVLLENTENRRMIVSVFATACRILNYSDDELDAELHLEDADGNRALMSTATVAVGGSGTLTADIGMLAQGEKIVLVITSAESILTDQGVWVNAQATTPPAPNGESLRRRVTSTTLTEEAFPPGADTVSSFGTGVTSSVSNFSATALTVDVYLVTDEGELLTHAAVSLPANTVTPLAPIVAEGTRIKLVFSALPPAGYLQYNQDYILPVNAFDAA